MIVAMGMIDATKARQKSDAVALDLRVKATEVITDSLKKLENKIIAASEKGEYRIVCESGRLADKVYLADEVYGYPDITEMILKSWGYSCKILGINQYSKKMDTLIVSWERFKK